MALNLIKIQHGVRCLKMKQFKNNQYYRSKLRRYGVTRQAFNSKKVYWPLFSKLHKEGWTCCFDVDEFHRAILTLR